MCQSAVCQDSTFLSLSLSFCPVYLDCRENYEHVKRGQLNSPILSKVPLNIPIE